MESIVIKRENGSRPRHFIEYELRKLASFEPWKLWRSEKFYGRGGSMVAGEVFTADSYVVETLSTKASKEDAIKWANRIV